jgi:CheY-like chemotaxis protein
MPHSSLATTVFPNSSRGAAGVGREVAIVDDEGELRMLFSRGVALLGYHVGFDAGDGVEIVRAVLEGGIHPDLILMDYRMPIMTGIEAAKAIHEAKPDIKIIVVTADDSVRQEAVSSGFSFLEKPFSIAALSKALEEALGPSRPIGPTGR